MSQQEQDVPQVERQRDEPFDPQATEGDQDSGGQQSSGESDGQESGGQGRQEAAQQDEDQAI